MLKNSEVYIVCSEYNMYDQMGSYYLDVYSEIPTKDELNSHGIQTVDDQLYRLFLSKIKEDSYSDLRVQHEESWLVIYKEGIK